MSDPGPTNSFHLDLVGIPFNPIKGLSKIALEPRIARDLLELVNRGPEALRPGFVDPPRGRLAESVQLWMGVVLPFTRAASSPTGSGAVPSTLAAYAVSSVMTCSPPPASVSSP